MKSWVSSLAVLVVVVAVASAQQHVAGFNSQDIGRLLKDSSLVRTQIKCVLKQGPCDRLGNDLKMAIPEVIHNNCKKCSRAQAANARNLKAFLQKNYAGVWEQVEKLY